MNLVGGKLVGRFLSVLTALLICLGSGMPSVADHPSLDIQRTSDEPALEAILPEISGPHHSLGNIDGFFTENLGQLGEGAGVLYHRGSPLSIALGPDWASYHYQGTGDGKDVLVRVDFEDVNAVNPAGRDALSHFTNFFKGPEEDWVVGARSYREVVYEGLWEGIDLVWRFADGSLKYDLLVAPQADIGQVAFRYSGQESLHVDEATGDLVIHTPVVDLVDAAPVSFQAGEELASSFHLVDDRTVALEVEGRDPSLPLVIDPGLTFSTYIGGSGWEFAGIMVDDDGDIYMGGMSNSPDFPTTPGVVYEEDFPDMDAIILKLKGDGSELLFSTYIGTLGYEGLFDVAVDPDENVVVAGFSNDSRFPTTKGAYQSEWGGMDEGFVMKLNHNCSKILWSTLLGGVMDDGCYYVEIFPNGSILVGGLSGGNDYPMVWGCYDTSYNGFFEAVLTILTPDGTDIIKSTYFGGDYYEDLCGMVLRTGENGGVYLIVETFSDNFPRSTNAYCRKRSGAYDIGIAKLDLNLTDLLYSTYIGGEWNDIPRGLAVDDEGCAYIIGTTGSSNFPTTPFARSI